MLRSTATRSLLKGISNPQSARHSYSAASAKFRTAVPLRQLNNKRPQVPSSLSRPTTTCLLYATKPPIEPVNKIDREAEKKTAEKIIQPHPEQVSTQSSVRRAFEGSGKSKENDQMLGSIKDDLKTVKDTFGLKDVPREPMYLGLAGVLPYAATSMSTFFLAYDIKHAAATGNQLLISPETAQYILDMMLPIQIGYGAVILSFLGAIHWGLEYAGYGGHHGYRRYMYGVIAPAVAWPTLLISTELALTTQFMAFTFQYFADARATVRGWCPPWYQTYRFVLTFLVGASLVLGLIGRGQLDQMNVRTKHAPTLADPDHEAQWRELELQEIEKREAETSEEEESSGDEKSDEKSDSGDSGDSGESGNDSGSAEKGKDAKKSADKK